jgi:hypothetical protein
MSRIDEEREAQRRAERVMLQKRQEEQKVKERADADSAFARLVGQSQEHKAQQAKDAVGKRAIAHLLSQQEEVTAKDLASHEAAAEQQRKAGKDADARGAAKSGTAAREAASREEAGVQADRVAGSEVDAEHTFVTVTAGQAADRQSSEGRKGDAREGLDTLEGRREGSEAAAQARAGGGAKGKGEVKADADGGGKNQGGSKDDKPGSDVGGFRFNPALMAPVPVARPKENTGSERLRRLASEIAQKIVERVRVGKNAAGKAEFQIDLRSTVLAGLSIKVSGSHGKIRAVFSGGDREVLKLLQDQAETLKAALTSRGLMLEELKIEERR